MLSRLVYSSALVAMLSVSAVANPASDSTLVIAAEGGFTFTESDLEKAIEIERILSYDGILSPDDLRDLKIDLLEEFRASPAELLTTIDEVYADVVSTETPETEVAPQETVPSNPELTSPVSLPSNGIGEGHRAMREMLVAQSNGQFSDGVFDTPDVAKLRNFITNSQIVSANFNDYSSGEHVYTFCPNGYFTYYYSSVTSILGSDVGVGISGTREDTASGVWETYHDSGQLAVLSVRALRDHPAN